MTCAAFGSSCHRLTCKEYLSAAVAYLEEDVDAERTSVDKIKGIWVASDDPAVLDEVRAAAPTYFPKVKSDAVIMVSSGVPGGPDAKGMQTRTEKQVRHKDEAPCAWLCMILCYPFRRRLLLVFSGG